MLMQISKIILLNVLEPNGIIDVENNITTCLNKLEIKVIDFEDMPGFVDDYYALRDIEYCKKIKEMRCKSGTYRSEEQCIAEAEVFIMGKKMNTQFLSLSTILNRLDNSNITWKPETLYRFLSMFSNVQPDSNLQYASLTQEFFSAGITIIDKDSMRRFASSSIKQTRMQFEKEKRPLY